MPHGEADVDAVAADLGFHIIVEHGHGADLTHQTQNVRAAVHHVLQLRVAEGKIDLRNFLQAGDKRDHLVHLGVVCAGVHHIPHGEDCRGVKFRNGAEQLAVPLSKLMAVEI